MATSMRLRVTWTKETLKAFAAAGISWNVEEPLTFTCKKPPLTVEDLCVWLEGYVEKLHETLTSGQDSAQVQIHTIKKVGQPEDLAWEDYAEQDLKDGDTILCDGMAMTDSQQVSRRRPQITQAMLEQVRATLRFGLNDRVLCFCGPRWLSGHIVGTAVPDEDSLLPYLVKTDPLPGLPSSTISVPNDNDDTCTQEVCFDPESELHLIKSAATLINGSQRPKSRFGSQRPKLRFATGDKVICRIKNDPNDGLENWVPGTVAAVWAALPGPFNWNMEGITGEFPKNVAYRVDLNQGGWVFCHKDHHTLIRREGMQPQSRVKGISVRMEVRKAKDGSREMLDHETERKKRMMDSDSDEDDCA